MYQETFRNIHRLSRNSVELMLVSLKLIFIHSMATSQKVLIHWSPMSRFVRKVLWPFTCALKKSPHTLYLSWHKPRQYPSCLVYRSCHLHHFKFKCQNMNLSTLGFMYIVSHATLQNIPSRRKCFFHFV